MATIQDIVTGALQKLGVIAGNETPSAGDSAVTLTELNDMMHQMGGKQIFISWSTMTLTDTFPLADHHIAGVKALLAERVSPAFGGDGLLSTRTVKQAQEGYSLLFGDYHRPELLRVDEGLQNMPGSWNQSVDNVNV